MTASCLAGRVTTWWRPTLTVLVLVLALPGIADGTAAAQEGAAAVRLVRQSPWVDPNGTFVAELRVDGVLPPDAELAVSLHQRITSRIEFERATTGAVGSVLAARTAVPLAEVPRGAGGTLVVTLPIRDASAPVDAARWRLSLPGVYPIQVEVRTPEGDVLAGLTTALVRVPDTVDGPVLAAGLVVPIAGPPALQPDGVTILDPQTRVDLTAILEALVGRPDVALTVQPVPETLEALRASPDDVDAALVEELGRALGGRQLLAAPFVSIDVTAWLDRDHADEVVRQLATGADVTTDVLAARPDGRTWVGTADLSPSTLQTLAGAGVDQAVVPEAILSPVDRPLTLAQPFEVAMSDDRTLRTVAADEGLAAHVPVAGADADPVLAAHRVLADLAVLYFDAPSLARGVVLLPPEGWRPGDGFLDALLEGLDANPIVGATTLDRLFRDVPPATDAAGEPLVRTLEPLPPEPLGTYPGELDRTRVKVAGYGSMTSVADPDLASFERRLLVASAASFTGGQRRAYLAAVDDEIAATTAEVALPARETVTLTARDAEIPLTITSTSDRPLQVRISLDSDKLDFPGGRSQVVTLEDEKTTLLFAVEARASGTFPVAVQVDSPDGQLPITTTSVTVRSTAVSNVGLVLSIGAAAFLLVWWAMHHRRVRRTGRRHSRTRPTRRREGVPV